MTCWIIHRAFAGGVVWKAKRIERHDHRQTYLCTHECLLTCLWAQWHKQPEAPHSRGFPPLLHLSSLLLTCGVLPVRAAVLTDVTIQFPYYLNKENKNHCNPIPLCSIMTLFSMEPLSIVFYFKQATWILPLLCYLLVKVQLFWCCTVPFNGSDQQPDIKSAQPLILQPGICPHHRKHSSKCPGFCAEVCIHIPYMLASFCSARLFLFLFFFFSTKIYAFEGVFLIQLSLCCCAFVFLRGSSSQWLDPASSVSALISWARLIFDIASGLSEPCSKLTAYLHAALIPSSVQRMEIRPHSLRPRYRETHFRYLTGGACLQGELLLTR